MDSVALLASFTYVFEGNLHFLAAGVVIGIVFGVIPGLGGPTALALLLPLTFSIDEVSAICLAGGVMGATSVAGSIPAILINTPGTPPNAATTYDGFPMTQRGLAGQAIGASATASALGGLIGLATLLAVIPLARSVILAFGPPEQLLITVLGLLTIAALSDGHILRSLIAGALGVALSLVGYDELTGQVRFTAGIDYFWDGAPLVPTLTGLFAVSQMIKLAVDGRAIAAGTALSYRVTGVWSGIVANFVEWRTLLRGSVIGTIIGALPGVGGTVASFIAYGAARPTRNNAQPFGQGNVVGVIAPESANNAKDGGSMIPTLAFGIPGSAETAVFLGILIMQGIEPGPTLLLHHRETVYTLIVALTLSALLASILSLLVARWLAQIAHIEAATLSPLVIVVALTGTFLLDNRAGDVMLAVAMGGVGYAMLCLNYPRIPFVIGFVLAAPAERAWHQTMQISDGAFWAYVLDRPLSVALIFLVLTVVAVPAIRRHYTRNGQ